MGINGAGTARQTVIAASWLTPKSDQVSSMRKIVKLNVAKKESVFPSKLSEWNEAVQEEVLP